jgi:hypothetical protein
MRCLAALVVLGACGRGSGGADGRSDDAPDAPDAYDASVCVTGTDSDGDGVCDAQDLCPDDPRPSTFDPDGDLQGWACDDNESVGMPEAVSIIGDWMEYDDGLFVVTMWDQCGSSTCARPKILVASEGDGFVAQYDEPSGEPAWLANARAILSARAFDGGLVVWAAPAEGGGPVGWLDPSTGAFTEIEVEMPWTSDTDSHVVVGDRVLLFSAGPQREDLYSLIQGEAPLLVASSVLPHGVLDSDYEPGQVLDGATPLAVIPVRGAAGFTLMSYRPGDTQLTQLTSDGSAVGPWSDLRRLARNDTVIHYAGRSLDGGYEDIVISQSGVRVYDVNGLPVAQTFIDAGLLLLELGPGTTAVALHSPSQAITLIGPEPGAFTDATSPPFHTYTRTGPAPDYLKTVWIVRQDGSIVEVGRDMYGLEMASSPAAIGILEKRLDDSPFGASVYFHRYNATGPDEEGLFQPNRSPTSMSDEFFVAHDGSILSRRLGEIRAVPQGASTPVVLDTNVSYHRCELVGSATLCGARHVSSGSSIRAYYGGAFHEVQASDAPYVRTATVPSSEYVVYDFASPGVCPPEGCTVGRANLGSEITLEPIFMPNTSSAFYGSISRTGRLIARIDSGFVAIDGTTVTPIAASLGLGHGNLYFDGDFVVSLDDQDAVGRYWLRVDDPSKCWAVPVGVPMAPALWTAGYRETQVRANGATLRVFRPRTHPDRAPPL